VKSDPHVNGPLITVVERLIAQAPRRTQLFRPILDNPEITSQGRLNTLAYLVPQSVRTKRFKTSTPGVRDVVQRLGREELIRPVTPCQRNRTRTRRGRRRRRRQNADGMRRTLVGAFPHRRGGEIFGRGRSEQGHHGGGGVGVLLSVFKKPSLSVMNQEAE